MKQIVIINSNIELIDALVEIFQDEGYLASGYQIKDIKQAKITIERILEEHKPETVLYDVSIPYDENWKLFLQIKKKIGDTSRIILTTTNKNALEKFVGKTYAIEIIEKPFSVEDLLKSVNSHT